MHRVMSHSLFPRKEGDSVVTTMELNVLYYMVNNIKLDVCQVIASKFKDVATKRAGVIKIGGLVLSIANYLGFDIDNMPFDKLLGPSLIDLHMIEAMGMVKIGCMGVPILIGAQQQVRKEEEEEESELEQMMSRMDTLELQVDVINSNVGELTSMAHEMNLSLHDVRHEVIILNQNLMAYF